MEAVILLIVFVLLLIVYNRMGDVKRIAEQQATDLTLLRTELSALRQFLKTSPVSLLPPEPIPPTIVAAPDPVAPPVSSIAPTPRVSEGFTEPVPEPQPVVVAPPTVPVPSKPAMSTLTEPAFTEPVPSLFARFMRDNPDLEKFVGENLINKIGIAILVLGIGYFVKYAIDQEWLGEVGRVAVGILSGAILLGLAHRLRQTFAAFSSVLVGGGLTVLYFTIAIAFHYYALFSQTGAFIIMVIITGFGVLLTLAYNRVELAVMTLIGGFATPFMVSTGEGNYVVLFSYLLILNVGMLVLSYFKKWTLVHVLAYIFTVLIYGGWLLSTMDTNPNPPYTGALLFASLFYAVFYAMNLLYNLKEKEAFTSADIALLISNTAFFYAAGMTALAHIDGGRWQGLFTVGVAVINFGVAQLLYRRPGTDRTLIYLLIGLVVTFISLAVPVQLEGNFITMFWAMEAVLLLWLAQKSGLRLMATSSIVVTGLMLLSLFMDWGNLYGGSISPALPIVFNKAFVTSVVAIAGLLGTRWLLARQEQPFSFWVEELPVNLYRRGLGYVTLVIIYLAGALETDYQSVVYYGFNLNRMASSGAYSMLFAFVLLTLAYRSGNRTWAFQASCVGAFALVAYIVALAPVPISLLQSHVYGDTASLDGFGWHYVSLASFIGLLVLLQRVITTTEVPPVVVRYWPWAMGFLILYVLSGELLSHVLFANFSDLVSGLTSRQMVRLAEQFDAVKEQVNKVGLPILWGVCAFAFMYVGLSRKNRSYRLLSLALFALTLLKLFFYDIRGISEGGRVAAFIILGALLLVISFMYQRIKRLLMADQPETQSL